MDYKKWHKLKECMNNDEPLVVYACNNYGETAYIFGKINKNLLNDKRSYAIYFDAYAKGKKTITLDLLLERPVILHDALFGKKGEKKQENIDTVNSFNVLRIYGRDSKDQQCKLIYKNPDEKTLLKFPVNTKNFNVNAKKNFEWSEQKSTKFLLFYLGQYVEVKQDDEVYSGILKAVFKPKDESDTFVELVTSSNVGCVKALKDKTKINVYLVGTKARSHVYRDKTSKEENVKDLEK